MRCQPNSSLILNFLDNLPERCYDNPDNLITHRVAGPAKNRGLLNKITGCESRTVPPLYVPMVLFFDESQSLGDPLGRQRVSQFPRAASTSQKTYAMDSPLLCVVWRSAFVAEKRLRHQYLVPQFSYF